MAKRIKGHLIAVDQGEEILFSDFEDDGDMWSGEGPRERRKTIAFSEPFAQPPSVHCGLSMWDMDHGHNQRADLTTEKVTRDGFTVVFRTWGDTRIARVRIAWMAIGAAVDDDQWQLY
ncbi:MAG: H-type lectin domain-containing protein [Sediminimonas sp.]|uniref:H-type lectin domain-containing protein n=1 Tax=Sediminimonas sp. TaxID=2823379 RepID=UPI00287011BD|nr:H-type lectin domain-containing protein [Sediminimonas sp.]MDR9485901.1 H-type lectin domain-containing protein [Sediminimonas sp.]